MFNCNPKYPDLLSKPRHHGHRNHLSVIMKSQSPSRGSLMSWVLGRSRMRKKNNVSIIARQDVSPKIDIRRRLWSRPQNLWSGWDVVHLPDTCVFLPHNLSESINSSITSYLLETFVASFWYLRQIFSANSLTHFTNPTFPNHFLSKQFGPTLAPFCLRSVFWELIIARAPIGRFPDRSVKREGALFHQLE